MLPLIHCVSLFLKLCLIQSQHVQVFSAAVSQGMNAAFPIIC